MEALREQRLRTTAQRDARLGGWRRRRTLMDVVGGGLIFLVTYLLMAWGVNPVAAVVSLGFGAFGGFLTSWLRGSWGAPIWVVIALIDMLLCGGGIFRLVVNAVLGNALALARRMDRMEGY